MVDCVFWNVHGFENLQNLDKSSAEILCKYEVVCLSETWLLSDPPPTFLSVNYDCIFSSAKKSHEFGRGSGGMAVYIKRATLELVESKVLSSDLIVLSLKHRKSQRIFHLYSVYINPTSSDTCYDKLNSHLLLNSSDPSVSVILGGDFNSRTGSYCNYDDTPLPAGLLTSRASKDEVLNPAGLRLLDIATEYSLVIMNGRKGETSGNFTRLGKSSSTVIDYVLVSWNLWEEISDFSVIPIGSSDHFPVGIITDNELAPLQCSDPNAPIIFSVNAEEKEYLKDELESRNPSVLPTESTVDDRMATLRCELIRAAEKLNLVRKRSSNICKNKPWYDLECKEAVKAMREILNKIHRKRRPTENDLEELRSARKGLKAVTTMKKREYFTRIQNCINNARDPREYWKAVKLLHHKSATTNPLKPEDWDEFYSKALPSKQPTAAIDEPPDIPDLVDPITHEEIKSAIKLLKNGKSPGLDGITNEVLKSLPSDWIDNLGRMFNQILRDGKVPKDWGTIEIVPLLKKGDPTDPSNYRGIALISCVAKLFTAILNNRLMSWAEKRNILPECQAGFRRKRGCVDQIFSLAAITSIHCRSKGRKLFTTFVDFKRCFDSIDHNKLWSKLANLGISGKFLKVIISLYNNAHFTVRTQAGHSKKMAVSEGVLQGEILSPLLFTLFTSDMEKFFRANGACGVSINSSEDLLLLMYADDTAILGYSEGDTREKLKILKRYCDLNGLTVNVGKTKIMLTSRHGRHPKPKSKFFYGEEEVEIVNEYTYLGIIFHYTGNFAAAANHSYMKAAKAMGPLWDLLKRSRCSNWNRRLSLFDSLASSILLYGAEVWGYNHGDSIERLQMKFLKSSLGVSPFTPNYATRLETARCNSLVTVEWKMIKWWFKLLTMDPDRTPKKLYLRLKSLHRTVPIENNWASQILEILTQADHPQLWNATDLNEIKKQLEKIRQNLAWVSHTEDWNYAATSDSSYYYQWYNEHLSPDEEDTWLIWNVTSTHSLNISRSVAQLRLASKKYPFLLHDGKHSTKIDPSKECGCCNMKSYETLEHLLFVCPQYTPWRVSLLEEHFIELVVNGKDILHILKAPSEDISFKLHLYVKCILKQRRLLTEE